MDRVPARLEREKDASARDRGARVTLTLPNQSLSLGVTDLYVPETKPLTSVCTSCSITETLLQLVEEDRHVCSSHALSCDWSRHRECAWRRPLPLSPSYAATVQGSNHHCLSNHLIADPHPFLVACNFPCQLLILPALPVQLQLQPGHLQPVQPAVAFSQQNKMN